MTALLEYVVNVGVGALGGTCLSFLGNSVYGVVGAVVLGSFMGIMTYFKRKREKQ